MRNICTVIGVRADASHPEILNKHSRDVDIDLEYCHTAGQDQHSPPSLTALSEVSPDRPLTQRTSKPRETLS